MTDLSKSELRLQLLEQKYLTLSVKTTMLLEASRKLIEEQQNIKMVILTLVESNKLTVRCEDHNCACHNKTNNGEQNTTTNSDSKESTNETTKDNAQTN